MTQDLNTRCYVFFQDKVLRSSEILTLESLKKLQLPIRTTWLVNSFQGHPMYLVDLAEDYGSEQYRLCPMKQLLLEGEIEPETISQAYQLNYFNRSYNFCNRCAGELSFHAIDYAKVCGSCDYVCYPRISPVVMVLVNRSKQLLLARGSHFKPGKFSALAGFIEAGENVESAARREVTEEVNVTIKDVKYFSSQSWPYPHSLIMGVHASYESGDIKCDLDEIEQADWFSVDNLPDLPHKNSISRHLIDDFLRNNG